MYAEPPNNTKFKPGQSGNPNGRPKKLNDQDMLKTLQQIIQLYADTKSTDKNTRHPAHKKLRMINDIFHSFYILLNNKNN